MLGPNGIGKTTLINCIANLLLPSQGHIVIDGQYMTRMPPQEVAKAIGFVPRIIEASFDYEVATQSNFDGRAYCPFRLWQPDKSLENNKKDMVSC